MKRLWFIALCSLLFFACSKSMNDEVNSTNQRTMFSAELESVRYSQSNNESAVVKKVVLRCADSEDLEISLFDSGEKVDIFRDISSCVVLLKEFDLTANSGTYSYSYTGNDLDDQVDIGIFSTGELSDGPLYKKLVRQKEAVSQHLCKSSLEDCDFFKVHVTFKYSELKSSTLQFENDLHISRLTVNADLEPAPDCLVSAAYHSHPSNPLTPPTLKITLTDCVNTLQSGQAIEYGFSGHNMGDVYMVDQAHAIISGTPGVLGLPASDLQFNPPFVEIEFTLEQLKILTGKSSTFDALKSDFVLALRNEDGISVAYYVIENNCSFQSMGNYTTFTQGGWQSPCAGSNPGCLRDAQFANVFPDGLKLGDIDPSSNYFGITFTSSTAIRTYLGAGGPPNSLSQNHVDPSSTESGIFGIQLTAVILNIEFDRSWFSNFRPSAPLLEDLIYQNTSQPANSFNGMTVKSIRSLAEAVISGASSAHSASNLTAVLTHINENFVDGTNNLGYLSNP